ncbi:MAG: HAD family hydrolase [Sphingomonadaceae bacterium]|nr:HAD family hydrolase [Sphingomonadaceae bacterium]|tara:strand:+ start:3641 stop:4519 length:879 start_codon:yes stop_codon:yes gene_type:complete
MAQTKYHRFDDIENDLTNAERGRQGLFSDNSFTKRLEARLDRALEGRRILSLDVFDTLVLRDNSAEITRFFEVGGRMAELVGVHSGKEVSQVDAFVARYLGTKATYRASRTEKGCREGSLIELHSTASRLLVGSGDLVEEFVAAELQNEATRIQPNPFLVKYVEKYREAGGKIVLLTDMYMHEQHVRKLLESLDIAAAGYDLILSSADTKASKASGGIFELAEDAMGCGPKDFVHLGDSFQGDVSQAIRRGWQALHLPLAKFDVAQRQEDHRVTSEMLKLRHALSVDIAMPH